MDFPDYILITDRIKKCIVPEKHTIEIPEPESTYLAVGYNEICKRAFAGNGTVHRYIVKDSVLVINDEAFADCPQLESVKFYGKVQKMGARCFDNCPKLDSIQMQKFSVPLINSIPPEKHILIVNGFLDHMSFCFLNLNVYISFIQRSIKMFFSQLLHQGRPDRINNFLKCGAVSIGNVDILISIAHDEGFPETESRLLELKRTLPKMSCWSYEYAREGTEQVNKYRITGYSGFERTIAIPKNIDGIPVTEIGVSWNSSGKPSVSFCSDEVEKIIIPSGIKKIADWTFAGCTGLKEMRFPESLDHVGDHAFDNTPFYDNQHGKFVMLTPHLLYKCLTDEKEVVIPEGVRKILCYSFSDNKTLEKVVFPDSITKIGRDAFSGCTSLRSVKLPPLRSFGSGCFSGCTSLQAVFFSKGTKWIAPYQFYECKQLAQVHLPEGLEYIGYSAFDSCNISRITIPETVKEIGKMAFAFNPLKEIEIPELIKEINLGTFINCKKLHKVRLPEKLKDIQDNAFAECYRLEDINIPQGVETIGHGAFSMCKRLSEFTFPAPLKTIEPFSFCGCSGLKEVTIPGSVETIKLSAFQGTDIQKLTLENGIRVIESNALSTNTNTRIINVPLSLKKVNPNSFGIIYESKATLHPASYYEFSRLPSSIKMQFCVTYLIQRESFSDDVRKIYDRYIRRRMSFLFTYFEMFNCFPEIVKVLAETEAFTKTSLYNCLKFLSKEKKYRNEIRILADYKKSHGM